MGLRIDIEANDFLKLADVEPTGSPQPGRSSRSSTRPDSWCLAKGHTLPGPLRGGFISPNTIVGWRLFPPEEGQVDPSKPHSNHQFGARIN